MMDSESQTWEDRCDRYFTSLSENERKEGTLKEFELRENASEVKKDDLLKDHVSLRDLRKETRAIKYLRQTFDVLDIHGAKFASRGRHIAELIVWTIITIGVFVAAVFAGFMQWQDLILSHPKYETVKYMSSVDVVNSHVLKQLSMSVCNLNLLRFSEVAGTDLEYLAAIENDTHVHSNPFVDGIDINKYIESNSKLKQLIKDKVDAPLNEIIKELNEDSLIKELAASSTLYLVHRLSLLGDTEMLRGVVQPTLSQIKQMGHTADDMMVECWVGGRPCRKSEKKATQDPTFGNCVTLSPEPLSLTSTVRFTLDAEVAEYINILTPSVGLVLSVHDRTVMPSLGRNVFLKPNRHTTVDTLKLTEINSRGEKCSDNTGHYKVCMETCFDDLVRETCKCSSLPSDPRHMCTRKGSAYIMCHRIVSLLNSKVPTSCDCRVDCRHLDIGLSKDELEWPSKESMHQVASSLNRIGSKKSFNDTYIRANVAMVTVNLLPDLLEVKNETSGPKILDVLARVGGITAFVAGVSMVTVCQVLWTVGRMVVSLIKCSSGTKSCNPQKDASLRRLSDSEVTSVTWAMYKNKRREEEIRRDDQCNGRPKLNHQIGGNTQHRIARMNSNSSHPNGDVQKQSHNGDNIYATIDEGHERHAFRNSRNISRNNHHQPHQDRHFDRQQPQHNRSSSHSYQKNNNAGRSRQCSEEDNKIFKMTRHNSGSDLNLIPNTHYLPYNDGGQGQGIHPGYDGSREAPSTEAVRLFGCSSAYFHPKHGAIQPVYL